MIDLTRKLQKKNLNMVTRASHQGPCLGIQINFGDVEVKNTHYTRAPTQTLNMERPLPFPLTLGDRGCHACPSWVVDGPPPTIISQPPWHCATECLYRLGCSSTIWEGDRREKKGRKERQKLSHWPMGPMHHKKTRAGKWEHCWSWRHFWGLGNEGNSIQPLGVIEREG